MGFFVAAGESHPTVEITNAEHDVPSTQMRGNGYVPPWRPPPPPARTMWKDRFFLGPCLFGGSNTTRRWLKRVGPRLGGCVGKCDARLVGPNSRGSPCCRGWATAANPIGLVLAPREPSVAQHRRWFLTLPDGPPYSLYAVRYIHQCRLGVPGLPGLVRGQQIRFGL